VPTPSTAKWPKPKSEDEFEDIVVDFVRIRWKDPNAQRFGRRGQRQHGVDIIGKPPWLGGRTAAAQCKNTDSLSLSDVAAEVAKALSFPEALAEFYVVTSAERDAALQSQVRAHFRANPAPFEVEVIFWPDVIADISGNADLVAKHWPGFGSNEARKHLLVIRAEAQRMKDYGDRLVADLRYGRWGHSLREKFRPQALENASIAAMSEIVSDRVLHQSLGSLRGAAAAADEAIDRVLRRLPLGQLEFHLVVMVQDPVLRATNEAHHVVSGIDRLLALGTAGA
jgi:hypothetical protein